MSAPRYLGLDLGTSSLKALVVDAAGRTLGTGSAPYPIVRPASDRAEQDPEAWWRAAAVATRAALAAAGRGPVAAIGLTGQMHGTVLLGDDDRPLAPAVIWMDRRAAAEVADLTEEVGRERLVELAGSPLAVGFQAATIRWLTRHRPDLWAATRTVLLPKDWLRFRLTGEIATDPSDASGTLLLDVRRRDWAPKLLAAAGADRGVLPPVRPSGAWAGRLRPEAAKALGLAAATPVVVGAGDAPAAALGAGIVDAGTLLLTLSTGAQVLVPAPEVRIDGRGRLHTFCAALDPGPASPGWYQMGAVMTAGAALRWLGREVFWLDGDDADRRLVALAAAAPAGARGLLFLPYLAGERTPHMAPEARGVFLGLTAAHGRPELARAVVEGVTFACADAFAALAEAGATPSEIVVAGGGARSGLWQGIVADVFGLPVRPLAEADQTALGAALLAAAADARTAPADLARAWSAGTRGEALSPDPSRRAAYEELLPIFRGAFAKLRDDFAALARFASARG